MASGTTDEQTLDECCLKEYRPLPGTPQGQMIKIDDINTYHIQGKDQTSKEKSILLLTDIFGLTKNPRITADEISEKSGFDVYVPDLFNGEAIPSSLMKNMPETPGEKMSFGTKIGIAGKIISYAPWLYRHRQSVTLPLLQRFIKNLRSERGIKRIEAVGYCFGGLYIMLLGSKQIHLVDAIVGCHVSQTNKTHFEQVDVPIAIVCAQEDNQFSDQFRKEVEKILEGKSDIPSRFVLTEGTVHGFASRPNPDNPLVIKAYEQTNDLIVQWAKTHL